MKYLPTPTPRTLFIINLHKILINERYYGMYRPQIDCTYKKTYIYSCQLKSFYPISKRKKKYIQKFRSLDMRSLITIYREKNRRLIERSNTHIHGLFSQIPNIS